MRTRNYISARIISLAAASHWHEGHTYGDGSYIEGHLLPVAKAAEAAAKNWTEDKNLLTDVYITGLFHDAIEDKRANRQSIREVLHTSVGEERAECIAEASYQLSREPDRETYDTYIKRLILVDDKPLRHIVLTVKHADITLNLNRGAKGLPSLLKRYERALEIIDPAFTELR